MPAYLPKGRKEVDAFLSEPDSGFLNYLANTDGDFGVLGAGGKMGTTVAQMLRRGLDSLGLKSQVYGISRYGDSALKAYHEELGIVTIGADLGDKEAVEQLPEMRNIIFMVGEKFGTRENPERAWVQNVFIPALVANRFTGSRFVVLSTGCVYPYVSVEGDGSSEADEPGPFGEYAFTCLGRERIFTHYSGQYGIPVSIIRLNYSNEFRYGVLVDIGRRVQEGKPVDLSTPYVNVIWQRDAVSRSLQAFAHASSPPKIINVAGPDKASVKELAEAFGQYFDKQASFTGVPGKSAWLSSSSHSDKLFGRPRTSLPDMIELIGGYLRQGGTVLNKPTKFEVRSGRF